MFEQPGSILFVDFAYGAFVSTALYLLASYREKHVLYFTLREEFLSHKVTLGNKLGYYKILIMFFFFFQNMDIGEYEPFLAVGFSTPPVDQDVPPTFGTLLSCVNVCLRLLMKVNNS